MSETDPQSLDDRSRAPPETPNIENFQGKDLFSCLARSDRRRLLGILFERAPESMPLDDLARALTLERDASVEAESDDLLSRTLTTLRHQHLPMLDAAGLIDHDHDSDTVAITDHPAFRDTGIVEAITGEADSNSDSLDSLFEALAHSRRRTILDILSHQFGSIYVETLARELWANGRETPESAVSPEAVQQLIVSLRHISLPRLSEAGVIEYDVEEGTVAYAGHPDLRVPWMHSVLEPDSDRV